MAPNRKQFSPAIEQPLMANIQLVQAKYLPLTQASSTTPVRSVAPQATIIRSDTPVAIADAYWKWTSMSGKQSKTIAAHENLFSAARFEQNAVRDSARRQRDASTKTFVHSPTPAPTDNYWEERVEAMRIYSQANALVSNTMGYWEWPEEKQVAALQLALIVREELARQVLSARATEDRLAQDAAKCENVQSDGPSKLEAEHDQYWSWSGPASTMFAAPSSVNESYWLWEDPSLASKAQQQQCLTLAILKYEASRSSFSGDHMQANLQVDCDARATAVAPALAPAADSYWNW